MVIYRAKPGALAALEAIVVKHGPVLRASVSNPDAPVQVFRATDIRDPSAGPVLVESFAWRDARASDLAHQLPEVMAVWETMGAYLADMSLWTLEPVGGPAGA
jgi:hypothetical protein